MPDRFLRKIAAPLGIALPPAGQYGAGLVFLPRLDGRPRAAAAARRAHRQRGRAAAARLADRADRRRRDRRVGARDEAGDRADFIAAGGLSRTADVASARPAADPATRRSRARAVAVRAQAVRHPQADRARGRSAAADRAARVLHPEPVVADADLQGDADGRPDRRRRSPICSIPTSSRRWRWCTSASARTRSRPGRWRIRTATSRTTARSTRCAATSTGCARAKGCCESDAARRRSEEDPADHPRRRQRHGDLRQRARVPRDGRAVAAARHPDDDPGAVGRATRACGPS